MVHCEFETSCPQNVALGRAAAASPDWKNLRHTPQIAWQFHSFDQRYLRRLASGDDAVEHHFSSYFGDLLLLKLRTKIRSPQLIEDIRQETLLRVLRKVRNGDIEDPKRFGAFVCGVCNNVMMELVRSEMRHSTSASEFEPADERVDLEAPLVTQQRRRQLDNMLEELPVRDRELLRMLFLEERDKSEICERFNVGEDYLRVLLHRAKLRFRSIYSKRFSEHQRPVLARERMAGILKINIAPDRGRCSLVLPSSGRTFLSQR